MALPKTVDEAVEQLIGMMGEDDFDYIVGLEPHMHSILHHDLGQWIRNNFGLWQGNDDLVRACGNKHPDDCSGVIIEALWKKMDEIARQEMAKVASAAPEDLPTLVGVFRYRPARERLEERLAGK